MELRKDPVTQSWVIQEDGVQPWPANGHCALCHDPSEILYEYPYRQADWRVRVVPHLRPLYRIEEEPNRRGEGIYDKMRGVGAHEIVIESRDHRRTLSAQEDEDLAQILRAVVWRIGELKKDPRFRYVTYFRNQGLEAGQELEHPHSQITAMPFIPRRIHYELRSSARYFEMKERCLLCDIVRQELKHQARAVEWDDRYAAFCPFASRLPFETWILPLDHHHSFEQDVTSWEAQLHLARFLKSVLRRLEQVTTAYHLVLHTCPNTHAKFEKSGHWRTLAGDSHWHFEILPLRPFEDRSYSVKEVYYNSLPPEQAAEQLRQASTLSEVRR